MLQEIKIIQGDSYYAEVEIVGLADDQTIEQLYFSCNFLGICKELRGGGGEWELEMSAEETEAFKVGKGTFDLTAVFSGKSIATVIYNNSLEILPKINRCDG